MFEGEHTPPYSLNLFCFTDGAQADFFEDSPLPVFDAQGVQMGSTMRERRGGDGRGCDADGGERTDDDEYACAECVEFVFIVERDCTGCHALALSSESS